MVCVCHHDWHKSIHIYICKYFLLSIKSCLLFATYNLIINFTFIALIIAKLWAIQVAAGRCQLPWISTIRKYEQVVHMYVDTFEGMPWIWCILFATMSKIYTSHCKKKNFKKARINVNFGCTEAIIHFTNAFLIA